MKSVCACYFFLTNHKLQKVLWRSNKTHCNSCNSVVITSFINRLIYINFTLFLHKVSWQSLEFLVCTERQKSPLFYKIYLHFLLVIITNLRKILICLKLEKLSMYTRHYYRFLVSVRAWSK